MNGGDPSVRHVATSGAAFITELRPALVKFFARKTGSATEAEDLAQEVLVHALTHAHWKTPEEAKGYVFKCAVNRWRDRYRRLRVRGETVAWNDDIAAECGADNSPEHLLMGEEELRRVLDALRTLTPRARNVLMLVKLENMKIAGVAASLGISVRTVNNDLARAMAVLARMRIR